MIGGTGADVLRGGADDDLLIGGTTAYDASPAALAAIRSEWARTDLGYGGRVAHLRNGGGGAWNGAAVLTGNTVTNDADSDQMSGEGGQEWFWARQAFPADALLDRLSAEVIN
jgi:hypothetical protein